MDDVNLCCTPAVPVHTVSIGELIAEGTRYVRHDVSARLLAALVNPTNPLVVIDVLDRFVGIVREPDLFAGIGRPSNAGDLAARVPPIIAACDVRRAVMHLALARTRNAPVVDRDNTPLGLLRDTHAMRWLRTT